jgi:hypothetical protein
LPGEGYELRFKDLQYEADDKKPKIFMPGVKAKMQSAFDKLPEEQRMYFRTLHMATKLTKYPAIFEEAGLDIERLKKKCKPVRQFVWQIAVKAYLDFILTGTDKEPRGIQIEDPSWIVPSHEFDDIIAKGKESEKVELMTPIFHELLTHNDMIQNILRDAGLTIVPGNYLPKNKVKEIKNAISRSFRTRSHVLTDLSVSTVSTKRKGGSGGGGGGGRRKGGAAIDIDELKEVKSLKLPQKQEMKVTAIVKSAGEKKVKEVEAAMKQLQEKLKLEQSSKSATIKETRQETRPPLPVKSDYSSSSSSSSQHPLHNQQLIVDLCESLEYQLSSTHQVIHYGGYYQLHCNELHRRTHEDPEEQLIEEFMMPYVVGVMSCPNLWEQVMPIIKSLIKVTSATPSLKEVLTLINDDYLRTDFIVNAVIRNAFNCQSNSFPNNGCGFNFVVPKMKPCSPFILALDKWCPIGTTLIPNHNSAEAQKYFYNSQEESGMNIIKMIAVLIYLYCGVINNNPTVEQYVLDSQKGDFKQIVANGANEIELIIKYIRTTVKYTRLTHEEKQCIDGFKPWKNTLNQDGIGAFLFSVNEIIGTYFDIYYPVIGNITTLFPFILWDINPMNLHESLNVEVEKKRLRCFKGYRTSEADKRIISDTIIQNQLSGPQRFKEFHPLFLVLTKYETKSSKDWCVYLRMGQSWRTYEQVFEGLKYDVGSMGYNLYSMIGNMTFNEYQNYNDYVMQRYYDPSKTTATSSAIATAADTTTATTQLYSSLSSSSPSQPVRSSQQLLKPNHEHITKLVNSVVVQMFEEGGITTTTTIETVAEVKRELLEELSQQIDAYVKHHQGLSSSGTSSSAIVHSTVNESILPEKEDTGIKLLREVAEEEKHPAPDEFVTMEEETQAQTSSGIPKPATQHPVPDKLFVATEEETQAQIPTGISADWNGQKGMMEVQPPEGEMAMQVLKMILKQPNDDDDD